MAEKLHVCIVSPTRLMYDDEADMVIMRGTEGDLGVLPGHIPLTASLAYGFVDIKNGSQELRASVLGGFVEISNNKVTVLSDAAEWPDEIDLHRAELAKERAERLLKEASNAADFRRAELALRRALVRLDVSSFAVLKGKTGGPS